MLEDGIKSDAVTYTAVIDALAKSESIVKAIEMFNSMKKAGISQMQSPTLR
jgi:pentatricopeptide repeat protein